jgi:hypothetical protein
MKTRQNGRGGSAADDCPGASLDAGWVEQPDHTDKRVGSKEGTPVRVDRSQTADQVSETRLKEVARLLWASRLLT